MDWLLDKGKDPEKEVGYSQSTVRDTVYKIDRFYCYVWTELEGGYTTYLTLDHGEDFLINLAVQDLGQSYKRGFEKALKRFYGWRHHVRGGAQWDLEFSFEPPDSEPPQDILSQDELKLLREAALSYGAVPSYSNVSPAERVRWKAYLAQRFGKPKVEIDREDWEKANSWKVPSLVWTSIDAGLAPREVGSLSVSWMDSEKGMLRVPDSDSERVRNVALQERTVHALEMWLEERDCYEGFSETDRLWLTKFGNPYQTDSLNYILGKLCESAEIDPSRRDISWNSIRDSVGVYFTDRLCLSEIQEQLRIKSSRTVARYERGVAGERKSVIEQMI